MKKIIIIFLLISFIFSCKKQELLPPGEYVINGTAEGIYNGVRVYLKPDVNPRNRRNLAAIDTAIVTNGTFSFRGKINNSSLQYLTINSVHGNFQMVLEPGITSIEVYKDSIAASKIIKAPENNIAYSIYKSEKQKRTKSLSFIRRQMNQVRRNNDNETYNTLYQQSLEISNAISNYDYEFIREHPKLDLSLLLLENITTTNTIDIDKFKVSILTLKDVINKNDYNKAINNKLNAYLSQKENEARVNIGKVAPNFSGTTPEGKSISLNDIKGKATIIDFWAAWCAPCRRENPNVVKIYEKYHDKGLEIISVSLDGRRGQNSPKADWLKAIEVDKLNWHHISSLNYFNEPAARLYNINSIPSTFILDDNGVIVSKHLRGAALEQKIAEILTK